IRTMSIPKAGQSVWVELKPMGDDDAVHLRGHVVWAKSLSGAGASPTGFAIRIDSTTTPADDVRRYEAGYELLLERDDFGLVAKAA
ncbi:MAG: hypothetical protein AAGF12_26100, partial [Myxococcota bacterium]